MQVLRGECLALRIDFPETGLFPVRCHLILSGLPAPFVGGLLVTNTMTTQAPFGGDTWKDFAHGQLCYLSAQFFQGVYPGKDEHGNDFVALIQDQRNAEEYIELINKARG